MAARKAVGEATTIKIFEMTLLTHQRLTYNQIKKSNIVEFFFVSLNSKVVSLYDSVIIHLCNILVKFHACQHVFYLKLNMYLCGRMHSLMCDLARGSSCEHLRITSNTTQSHLSPFGF